MKSGKVMMSAAGVLFLPPLVVADFLTPEEACASVNPLQKGQL